MECSSGKSSSFGILKSFGEDAEDGAKYDDYSGGMAKGLYVDLHSLFSLAWEAFTLVDGEGDTSDKDLAWWLYAAGGGVIKGVSIARGCMDFGVSDGVAPLFLPVFPWLPLACVGGVARSLLGRVVYLWEDSHPSFLVVWGALAFEVSPGSCSLSVVVFWGFSLHMLQLASSSICSMALVVALPLDWHFSSSDRHVRVAFVLMMVHFLAPFILIPSCFLVLSWLWVDLDLPSSCCGLLLYLVLGSY